MSLRKHSGNHHEDTRASLGETRKRPSVGRNDDSQRVSDAEPGGGGVERVLRQQVRIRGVDVLRAVQVQSACPLVTEAEFPGARYFALDGEICLVRVAILEILRQGKCEREDGKRESGGQVILIGKERTRSKRIEALLIGEVKHARERVQHALENGRAVEIGRGVQAIRASRGDKTASGGRAARREQLYGTATVGSRGVESRGQQRMVIEDPEARADNGLFIASGIPCQSNSGTYVLIIARNAFHDTKGLLRGGIYSSCGREERADFHVVAHAVIDGQVLV